MYDDRVAEAVAMVMARARRLMDASAGGSKTTPAAAVRKRTAKSESRRDTRNEELPGRS